MNQVCTQALQSITLRVLLTSLTALSACANVPYIAGEVQGVKQQADLQTGSNLARRGQGGTGARDVDKDALESSLRGTNANRDNGK